MLFSKQRCSPGDTSAEDWGVRLGAHVIGLLTLKFSNDVQIVKHQQIGCNKFAWAAQTVSTHLPRLESICIITIIVEHISPYTQTYSLTEQLLCSHMV